MLIPWSEFVRNASRLTQAEFLDGFDCPFLCLQGKQVKELEEETNLGTKTYLDMRSAMASTSDGEAYEAVVPVRKGADNPFGYMVTLGRAANNDIRFTSRRVSAFHAYFRQVGDRWSISDASSSNGVFVNGTRLSPERSRPVRSGDAIGIAGEIQGVFLDAIEVWRLVTKLGA